MRKRIKDGKKRANEINPSIQDFISALQDAPARASRIYKEFKARDYIQLKGVMDALEPFLPEKVKITWKIIDSIHSGLE
jgi:DNA-binding transcriptional MocR family regulator